MLLYEDVSYKIRGACFGVFNVLGGGIREKIPERALLKELRDQGLGVENQARIDVLYKGEKIGAYIPDFVVENAVIIEIKSKPFLYKTDEKQFWGYLKGSRFQLGFLVNFGPQRVDVKRFVHTGKKSA